MRSAINVLLLKEPICAECFQAFWTNITVKASARPKKPS
jgi:hypothetical protein